MRFADIDVSLIDYMGSDLSVVNAARVSFAKESEAFSYRFDVVENQHRTVPILTDRDHKLIAYLAKNGHWSPFAHAFASFRIKTPIFVARQLVKHQVGLSWNEVSRRYVDDEPEFFLPDEWRKRADNVKQGSADETIVWLDREKRVATAVREANARALEVYEDMLNAGVAPEMARMVLPQNTMTEWIWSGSLYAFARVCNQRLDAHAQKETRDVAVALDARLRVLFPVSWRHLVQAGAAEVHPGDPGEPGSEVQVV